MPRVKIDRFAGLMPRTSSKLLDGVQAQAAHNCRLKSGRIEPVRHPLEDGAYPSGRCRIRLDGAVPSVGLAPGPGTIYLWRFRAGDNGAGGSTGAGEYWLSWPGRVSCAKSTVADDERARLWIAGQTGVPGLGGTQNAPAVVAIAPADSAAAAASCDASKVQVRRVAKAPPSGKPSFVMMDLWNPLNAGGALVRARLLVKANIVFPYGPGNTNDRFTSADIDAAVNGTLISAEREGGRVTLKYAFAPVNKKVSGSVPAGTNNPTTNDWVCNTRPRHVIVEPWRTLTGQNDGDDNLSNVRPLFQSHNFGSFYPNMSGDTSGIFKLPPSPSSEVQSVMGIFRTMNGERKQVGELVFRSCKLDGWPKITVNEFWENFVGGDIGGHFPAVSASLDYTVGPWTCTVVLEERYSQSGTLAGAVSWTVDGFTSTHPHGMPRFTDTVTGYNTEYCQTWVDDWGQESPPSDFTGQLSVSVGRFVRIGPAPAPIPPDTVARRIYRTFGGEWRFVKELPVPSGEAWDNDVPNTELGEIMPVIENPPDDLDGIVSAPGGFMAGFRAATKEICFTEPFLPYSWPSKYRLTIDDTPVALAVSGNDIFALTVAEPRVVTGGHPDVMNIQTLAFPQSCASRGGVASLEGVVYYVSPDGICALQAGGVSRLVTDKFFTRDDWQRLKPVSILMAAHDTALFCFCKGADIGNPMKCYIIDFADGISAVTTSDEEALCLFSDVNTDTLYFAASGCIWAWGASDTPKVFVWKSKRFQGHEPMGFSCMRITADKYGTAAGGVTYPIVKFNSGESPVEHNPVAVADGASQAALAFSDQRPRRMPMLRKERVFEVTVIHNAPVDDVVLATSMAECKQ